MKDAVEKPDYVGALRTYNDNKGMQGNSFASVANLFPGVNASSLRERFTGLVEVNAIIGRPASITTGDRAGVRECTSSKARFFV